MLPNWKIKKKVSKPNKPTKNRLVMGLFNLMVGMENLKIEFIEAHKGDSYMSL